MLREFVQFLCSHKQVPARRVAEYGRWQPGSRERFGSIALRHGMLTVDNVDEILQDKRRLERFGETASRLGLLAAEDVERVLMIQSFQDLTDFVEWVLVRGMLTNDELVKTMAEFWGWLEVNKPNPWARELDTLRDPPALRPVAASHESGPGV